MNQAYCGYKDHNALRGRNSQPYASKVPEKRQEKDTPGQKAKGP